MKMQLPDEKDYLNFTLTLSEGLEWDFYKSGAIEVSFDARTAQHSIHINPERARILAKVLSTFVDTSEDE